NKDSKADNTDQQAIVLDEDLAKGDDVLKTRRLRHIDKICPPNSDSQLLDDDQHTSGNKHLLEMAAINGPDDDPLDQKPEDAGHDDGGEGGKNDDQYVQDQRVRRYP